MLHGDMKKCTGAMGVQVMRRFMVLGLLLLSILGKSQLGVHAQGTVIGFYDTGCPRAENLIRDSVTASFRKDKSIAAALLRMQYHDCFVTGCDASILLNSTATNQAEKDAPPNLTLRGFDVIDRAKEAVEAECPGIVSCADVIALATRDAVSLVGGQAWPVPTGRRDGRISVARMVDLPTPTDSVTEASQKFAQKGLNMDAFVTLMGAHTLGVAHCSSFRDRLYNFLGQSRADPFLNQTLLFSLREICPFNSSAGKNAAIALDQGTREDIFDNSYYSQILQGKGILQLDQELALNPSTRLLVQKYATGRGFAGEAVHIEESFKAAMVKLGNIGVLTGTLGEIRRVCSAVN